MDMQGEGFATLVQASISRSQSEKNSAVGDTITSFPWSYS